MTPPSHAAALTFASRVASTGTNPDARNLAAAYLELRAEETSRNKSRAQKRRRAREQRARERAARDARGAAGQAAVERALGELRAVNAERRARAA
jgi:hypothetical protein